jgi:cobalt-zinc-cadmium resistance protein CzcA
MRLLIILTICFSSSGLLAQENNFSLSQAVDYALKNNASIKTAEYHAEAQRQMKKASVDLPKTEVSLMYGQYNGYPTNDNNITITQSIPFFALGSQAKLSRSQIAASELGKAVAENELVYQVKQTYYQLAHSYSLRDLLLQQDSIFEGFYRAASARYKAGETNLLEQTTAEAQRNEAKNRVRQIDSDIVSLKAHLRALLNTDNLPDIRDKSLTEIELNASLDTGAFATNPSLAFSRQQIEVANAQKKVQAARGAPDFLVGYFNQTLIGVIDNETGAVSTSSDRFTGFQVGVAIPLWFGPHQGRTRAAEFTKRAAESSYTSTQKAMAGQLQQAIQLYEKNKTSLIYYRETGLPNASLILKQSQAAFRNGEIGYAEYLLGLRNANAIRENYLRTLNDYNQSIIFIEFLSGNKSN